MRTFRVDVTGIPVSTTGRRWLETMYARFPREAVLSVLVDATTHMSKRGGRQVTRDDLNAALDEGAPATE